MLRFFAKGRRKIACCGWVGKLDLDSKIHDVLVFVANQRRLLEMQGNI